MPLPAVTDDPLARLAKIGWHVEQFAAVPLVKNGAKAVKVETAATILVEGDA